MKVLASTRAVMFTLSLVIGIISLGSLGTMAEDVAAPTNAALGKSYQYVGTQPHANYPDETGKQLTDGEIGSTDFFHDENWVSFWHNGSFSITIDLEEAQSITRIRTHHLAGPGNILWPHQIAVSVSADGDMWQEVATLVPEASPQAATLKWFEFALDAPTTAKYVSISFRAQGNHIHLSEIEVHTN